MLASSVGGIKMPRPDAYLVPVLAVYLVFNSVVLVAIVRRVRRSGNRSALYTWFVVALLWLATVGYDHHRSFRVIDPKYGTTTNARAAG